MPDVTKKEALRKIAEDTERQAKLKRNKVRDESKAARVKRGETFE